MYKKDNTQPARIRKLGSNWLFSVSLSTVYHILLHAAAFGSNVYYVARPLRYSDVQHKRILEQNQTKKRHCCVLVYYIINEPKSLFCSSIIQSSLCSRFLCSALDISKGYREKKRGRISRWSLSILIHLVPDAVFNWSRPYLFLLLFLSFLRGGGLSIVVRLLGGIGNRLCKNSVLIYCCRKSHPISFWSNWINVALFELPSRDQCNGWPGVSTVSLGISIEKTLLSQILLLLFER